MRLDGQTTKRVSSGLLGLVAAACLITAGCSDVTPEPDEEGGGIVDSPTHEADQLRDDDAEAEAREEEGGRRR